MHAIDDIVWEGPHDRIVLSPRLGGRVIAWSHRGSKNLAREPQQFEGGMLRTLLAEERYPGSSYCTPHLVLGCGAVADGFRANLRHYWHAPNVFARLFGWPEKLCPRYLDGLLLDKVVTFHAEQSALVVELTISNLNETDRQITPWVQHAFRDLIDHGFVVRDGVREAYRNTDNFWVGHPVDGAATMRMVQTTRDEEIFIVLGAQAAPLAGMLKYDPADFGAGATMGMQELRYRLVRIGAGECWQANYFVAVGGNYARWAEDAPVPLHAGIAPSTAVWNERDLLPTLAGWATPAERACGLMVFSFLDKLPFTSSQRFRPADALAGFHAGEDGLSRATVSLYALRDLPDVSAALAGVPGWSLADESVPLTECRFALRQHELRRKVVAGPETLAGKEELSLTIRSGGVTCAQLHVPPEAQVEPRYPYQFKQMATYLEERVQREKLAFSGTPNEFRGWQAELRARYREWMRDSVIGPCPLEPRLLERQVGPTCTRDKIALQTEPGMWLPAYVVYPNARPAKMPIVILYHGSGPGKQAFVPDEDPADIVPECENDLVGMPYALAQRMGCLVYIPDQRSQGEWGEVYSMKAARRVGYNSWAMRMWDHMRSLDYLCARLDVDASRIGCLGSSGGGSATMYTAGIDERVRAAILSSMPPYLVTLPGQYFNDMWSTGDYDDGWDPLKHAPSMTVNVCALTIPRPLWIMDGTHDAEMGDPRAPDAEEIFARARARYQAARDEIARLYDLVGAGDRFRQTWFPGGHTAGMTVDNAVEWFEKWF